MNANEEIQTRIDSIIPKLHLLNPDGLKRIEEHIDYILTNKKLKQVITDIDIDRSYPDNKHLLIRCLPEPKVIKYTEYVKENNDTPPFLSHIMENHLKYNPEQEIVVYELDHVITKKPTKYICIKRGTYPHQLESAVLDQLYEFHVELPSETCYMWISFAYKMFVMDGKDPNKQAYEIPIRYS